MRWCARLVLVALIGLATRGAGAQQLTENFDDVSALPAAGWVFVNNSDPTGSSSWFQGNTAVFSSQAGAANSYMGANFAAAMIGGNVSLWSITPLLTNLQNGETLSFYTRTEPSAPAPDRLEVRLCIGACAADVGSTDTSVGNFGTLLLSINPMLTADGFPSTWTQFNIDLSGLPPGSNQGRIAFRYTVTDTSVAGDYIGLDTLNLTSLATQTPTATSTATPTQTGTPTQTRTPFPMTPKPNGASCSNEDQCRSGFCVDGFCCNTACDQPLEQCNQPGYVGTCRTGAPAPALSPAALLAGLALLIGIAALRLRSQGRRPTR